TPRPTPPTILTTSGAATPTIRAASSSRCGTGLVVNRLGRAPSEAGGVAFGCAGAFRIGLQSGVHVACIGPHRPCIGHRTGYSLHENARISGLASADFVPGTPSSCSTEKSWLHFRPPPVDFCSSRLAIGAASERARALAMPAGTRAQALQTRANSSGVVPASSQVAYRALLERAGSREPADRSPRRPRARPEKVGCIF